MKPQKKSQQIDTFKYNPAQGDHMVSLQLGRICVSVAFVAIYALVTRKYWWLIVTAVIISLVLLVFNTYLKQTLVFSELEVRHQIGKRIVMRIPWHQLKAAGVLTTNTGKRYLFLCGAGKKRILSIGQKNVHRWNRYISQDIIARATIEEDGLWKLCLAYYLCTMGGEADEPTFLLKMDDEILEAIRRYSPLLPLDLNLFG